MKINKTAVQRTLDLAAEELDRLGYADLADKVDFYNDQIVNAASVDVNRIRRALGRIQLECELRRKRTAVKDNPPAVVEKAQNAVMHARRASIKRKLALNRLLRKRASAKKKKGGKVAVLKSAEVIKENFSKKLEADLEGAEDNIQQNQKRVERIKRVQKALAS